MSLLFQTPLYIAKIYQFLLVFTEVHLQKFIFDSNIKNQMSSLFSHETDVSKVSSNPYLLIKNKNKSRQRKLYLNVKKFQSPSPKSLSKRKNSAMKLFRQAHKVGSQTTKETYLSPEAKSKFKIDNIQSFHEKRLEDQAGSKNLLKTKRVNTMEQKRTKITLKKTLSQGNNIQNTIQVCINGEALKSVNHNNLMSDLTRMILNENQANKEDNEIDWSNFLQNNAIDETSFELQIDSNLIQNSKNAQEWEQLIKRI